MAVIDRIYRAMALTTEDVPETLIQSYLDDWDTIYPDDGCLSMHNTVISVYEYLARSEAPSSSGGGKIREKEGGVEYETSGSDKSVDWKNALSSYLKSPWTAFPLCRVELSAGITGRVKVGGVDETKIAEINDDDNRRTGGADEITGIKRSGVSWNSRRSINNRWTLG